MSFRRHIITITIIFIALACVWVSSNINWGDQRWTRIIKVDGNGYYAYLPAVFIYHDLHFGFFEDIASKEGYSNMGYEYRYEIEGKTVNKYFAGTALAQLPFFLAAHALSMATGYPADGYSFFYLVFISLASIFYLVLAVYFINKILALYSIYETNRAIALLAIVFGTNIFYYTAYEPSMSHIYSLGFTSIFIYTILKYFRDYKVRDLMISGLVLGVIFLIRPVNVMIIVSVPFLAGSRSALQEGLKRISKDWGYSLLAVIVLFLPIMVQSVIYYVQAGSYWIYSYGEERFNFFQPHLFSMLFSYRKGLFIYTPILLIALVGLYYPLRRNAYAMITWICFFLLLTYILSCWHQWYYGGSFGSRVFIEYYPLFAILLGLLLGDLNTRRARPILIGLMSILLVYNLIQTYQYYAGIIHWSEMSRELYWQVFLKFK